MAEMRIEGLETLMARLAAISEQVVTDAGKKALQEGGEVLRREISSRAPRDTGKLADNIMKSGVKTKDGMDYIEVGPSKKVFYSLFLEFGTTKMSARPFIVPAMEESRNEIFNAIAEVLRRELARQ